MPLLFAEPKQQTEVPSEIVLASEQDARRGVEPVKEQTQAKPVARLPDGTAIVDLDVAARNLPRYKARQDAESRVALRDDPGDITFVPYASEKGNATEAEGSQTNWLLVALLGYGAYQLTKGK